jgi:hypothetical protein
MNVILFTVIKSSILYLGKMLTKNLYNYYYIYKTGYYITMSDLFLYIGLFTCH